MEVLAGPVGKNEEAEYQTNPTADGDRTKALMRHRQHVIDSKTRHSDQIEGHYEYHHSIVVILPNVWDKSNISSPHSYIVITNSC